MDIIKKEQIGIFDNLTAQKCLQFDDSVLAGNTLLQFNASWRKCTAQGAFILLQTLYIYIALIAVAHQTVTDSYHSVAIVGIEEDSFPSGLILVMPRSLVIVA